jgi:hypothetical protein
MDWNCRRNNFFGYHNLDLTLLGEYRDIEKYWLLFFNYYFLIAFFTKELKFSLDNT